MSLNTTEKEKIINRRDAEHKREKKQQREWRKTKDNNLLLGYTPYEFMFFVVCSIYGFERTARRVRDRLTVFLDASKFKLVNALIKTTDQPGMSQKTQAPQSVPDLEIPG